MGRLASWLAGLAIACLLPSFAGAQTACVREGSNPRNYLDCLGNRQKQGERDLERALAGALATIGASEAIQPVQRKRWANLMEEAQSRFIHWRNFECQSIAPYEGGGAQTSIGGRLSGIGALEQRLVCLIERNAERASDLARRYPPPSGWTYAEPAPEPAPATDNVQTTPAPAGPVRIIDMPR